MKKLKNHKPLSKQELTEFNERIKVGVNNDAYSLLTYTPCTGCTPTSPNGGCFEVGGVCTWIPEIG